MDHEDGIALTRHLLLALLLIPGCRSQAAPDGIQETMGNETITTPGYPVGEFQEGPQRILKTIDGQDTLLLQRWDDPSKTLEVPVEALRLVAPNAKRTHVGLCAGNKAATIGARGTRNRAFYRNPRVACAAFTAFCFRHCGRRGLSFSASQQYAQVRKRGGRLVASRVSTRYAPYFKYYQQGDLLFFHKGRGRIGHVEICVANGWTVGTSSSAGRVGRRRIGNRGFSQMSVVRL